MGKLKERWKSLDQEIRDYFFWKAVILGLTLLAAVLAYFFVYVKSVSVLLLVIFITYGLWMLYLFAEGMCGNIYVYEGTCLKKNERMFEVKTGIKKPIPIYGRTTAVIQVTDNDNGTSANIIIPVGYSYDIRKGYVVRVYATKNSLITKNENTFALPSPILIRVAKNIYEEDEEKEEENA